MSMYKKISNLVIGWLWISALWLALTDAKWKINNLNNSTTTKEITLNEKVELLREQKRKQTIQIIKEKQEQELIEDCTRFCAWEYDYNVEDLRRPECECESKDFEETFNDISNSISNLFSNPFVDEKVIDARKKCYDNWIIREEIDCNEK